MRGESKFDLQVRIAKVRMSQKTKRVAKRHPNESCLFPSEEGLADHGGVPRVANIERWPAPKSWTWTTVGEVAEVKAGLPRTPKNRPGLFPTKYLRTANITAHGLNLAELFEMEVDAEQLEVFSLRPGDVVLTESSGSPNHVGKAALWRGEIPVCCFQNHVLRFRSPGVSSEYALLVFQHYSENGLIASLVRGIGIGHLGVDNFSRLPFPLPPRKEQDRIVTEFTLQARRAKTALDALQSAKLKMGLQRQAVVRHELGLENDRGTASEAPVATKGNPVRLGNVCEAINGRAFKAGEWQETGLPIIRIQNLRDPSAEFNYFGGDVEEKYVVNKGDLLFAWSGTPGTSFGAFLWDGPRGALNQHIFKLICDQSRVSNDFLYHAINQNLDDYIAAAQGGGGLAHLKRQQFLDSKVFLPPLVEQQRIVTAIKNANKALDDQEAVIDRNVQQTRMLRQALLIRAVEGKLVEQDEEDGGSAKHLSEIKVALAKYNQELKARRKQLKGTVTASTMAAQTAPKWHLLTTLERFGPLPVKDLFKKAGFREERPDEVETFYRLLDKAIKSKNITSQPSGGSGHALLKAVKR
jgi:restriction endonuclease S subunit